MEYFLNYDEQIFSGPMEFYNIEASSKSLGFNWVRLYVHI